jgi:DNA-damage-inducible protein D
MSTHLTIFQDKHICRHRDEQDEKRYFSVIDIVEIASGSDRPRKYWSDLKAKLLKEGSEVSEKIGQLKHIIYNYN